MNKRQSVGFVCVELEKMNSEKWTKVQPQDIAGTVSGSI